MSKISEKGREILKKWQDLGVNFSHVCMEKNNFDFTGAAEHYSIPEQPLPQGISRGWLTAAEKLGIRVWLDYKTCQYFTHAQPIPKELLEMEDPKKEILTYDVYGINARGQTYIHATKPCTGTDEDMGDDCGLGDRWAGNELTESNLDNKVTTMENKEEPKKDILIHHPEERMLWLQQRIAGTNELWQRMRKRHNCHWFDIPVGDDPEWSPYEEYRQKPKTVKYYFCVIRRKDGSIGVFGQHGTREELESSATFGGATIIGNIEERDVEV